MEICLVVIGLEYLLVRPEFIQAAFKTVNSICRNSSAQKYTFLRLIDFKIEAIL